MPASKKLDGQFFMVETPEAESFWSEIVHDSRPVQNLTGRGILRKYTLLEGGHVLFVRARTTNPAGYVVFASDDELIKFRDELLSYLSCGWTES